MLLEGTNRPLRRGHGGEQHRLGREVVRDTQRVWVRDRNVSVERRPTNKGEEFGLGVRGLLGSGLTRRGSGRAWGETGVPDAGSCLQRGEFLMPDRGETRGLFFL